MADSFSKLQQARQAYRPSLPRALSGPRTRLVEGEVARPPTDAAELAGLFPATFGKPLVSVSACGTDSPAANGGRPLRVGCILSGGQAPGGHNVIAGLYDFVRGSGGTLFGFLDGPRGLFTGKYIEVDDALMSRYRNMGGFDMIGSGRDKIETPEQFAASAAVAGRLMLDGVIVIGGDDSNTNAALLAEYFAAASLPCRVIGVPKTIDGDLRVPGYIDISFGFDTACAVYSELIGNVCLDVLASGKYYHFIRLMGRAASNITLECALQTHPNVTLLGEEVAARKQNLASVTEEIVQVILERAASGKLYGVVLVPEGLVEFVPEMNALLKELNELLAHGTPATVSAVGDALTANNAALFSYLPASIRKQLLAERDPHGNVQVSLIETEKLLAETVAVELARRARAGSFPHHFSYQTSFFGYEARCSMPSDFDTAYCYALGANAAALLAHGQTGLISSVTNLGAPVQEWACGGVPLTVMMNLERRHGKDKPVIKKALVELAQLPFRAFASQRTRWAIHDCYRVPGPVQLSSSDSSDGLTRVDPLCFTLALELAERAAAAGGTGGAHHRPIAAGDASAAYRALVDGLVSTEGLDAVTPGDVHKLELYRLAHGIDDVVHAETLAACGVKAEAWAAVLVRTRKAAASAGHS